MDWFLYDNGLRHERVKQLEGIKKNYRTGDGGYSLQEIRNHRSFMNCFLFYFFIFLYFSLRQEKLN